MINAGEGGVEREISYTVRICKLVQSLWRTMWKFLKKLKLELTYDPAIPILSIYPEKSVI